VSEPIDMAEWRKWFASSHEEDAGMLEAFLSLSAEERIELLFYMIVSQGDISARRIRAAQDVAIAAFNA
jgi:hypothetical protein